MHGPTPTRVTSARTRLCLLFALALAVALAACGGSSKPPTAAPGSSDSNPPAGATTASQPNPPAQASDLQSRVSDSMNRTLGLDQVVLPSYHVEINATEPQWNKDKSQVETKTLTVKADVIGQDVYMTETTKQGDQTDASEGYIVKGGIGNSDKGGKEYELQEGKLKPALGFSMRWVALPLEVGLPLIIAASGARGAGQESVDGRTADKIVVDTANAPAGTNLVLGQFISISNARGTAWVDKATGALLKLTLDYQQDLIDPPGSKTVVGKGNGHIELQVTGVGKTTIKTPPISEDSGAAVPPAPGNPSTPGPLPTDEPPQPTAPPKLARVGQRTEIAGIALTVNKVDVTQGPEAYKADDGKTFVAVYVTAENVGKDSLYLDFSQFEFQGQSGDVYPDLENGTGGEQDFSPDTFDSYELEPGKKIENRIILIQLEPGKLKGLNLLFHMDENNTLRVELGL